MSERNGCYPDCRRRLEGEAAESFREFRERLARRRASVTAQQLKLIFDTTPTDILDLQGLAISSNAW